MTKPTHFRKELQGLFLIVFQGVKSYKDKDGINKGK